MKNTILFICLLICIAGCKKHSDTTSSSQTHEFKGIDVIDEGGEILGTWGTEDGDWGTDAHWTTDEYGLLNFPDTISLEGTYISDTTGWNNVPGNQQPQNLVIVYPNPTKNMAVLVSKCFGNIKLKAVIVDKYYNRLKTFAIKWGGLVECTIDLSDSTKFQSGNLYRLYYAFSSKDSVNFFKGHGDILICRDPVTSDCKKFVP